MEMIKVELNDRAFDEAVHGKPEGVQTVPECGDLAIYVKKRALTSGKAGAVISFTVQLPNGKKQPVQAVTTVTNLIAALATLKGWRDGGHLEEPKS